MAEKKYSLELPVLSGGHAPPDASGAIVLASPDQPFVTGKQQTPVGTVPRISAALTGRDRLGTLKARLGVNRSNYRVEPGLYALGCPDETSPVLASANYKMSFDCLRGSLSFRDAWILVLDTKGINVWCAAGKGTFGTNELVYRIAASGLKKVVAHRRIILPQLAAPGVAAHTVKLLSGFRVHYGPVRAADLPAYLDAGLSAGREMRKVSFGLWDRAVLIPVELAGAAKYFFLASLAALLLAVLLGPAGLAANLFHDGLFAVAALGSGLLAGAVLHPLALPWLPGRAFSQKGATAGLIVVLGLLYARGVDLSLLPGKLEALAWFLIVPAVAAFLAMNFTGCSTYTSPAGVKKEMRLALPLEISAAALGSVLWIAALFTA